MPLHSLVVLLTRSRRRSIALLYALALGLAGTQGASASNSIDVLALYTPLAKQELGGDHASVVAAIESEFIEANATFTNSDLDPTFRYEIVETREICFDERGKIRMDLQWLHENLQVAALRDGAGADVVLLLTGTANYGGMAWAIFSSAASNRKHAFIVVESFALATLTVGHELGHTMGCAHNPEILILPDPPVASNYAYMHWQEEPHFRTLLSYYSQPNPDGPGVIVCEGCRENQLNVFSSPDVWYLHSGPGDTLEELCTLADNGDGSHAVACANGATGSIPSNAIDSYAVAVGTSLSNNRAQVQSRYDITAAYYDPPLASGCAEDCGALSRSGCTTAGGACGDCLWPTVESESGSCIDRAPPLLPTPISDGCYGGLPTAPPGDGSVAEVTLDLGSPHAVEQIHLHFGTWDATTGEPSYAWAPNSFMNWNPPPPPHYSWELLGSNDGFAWSALETGTQDTPASQLIGDSNGHHMMWRAWERELLQPDMTLRYVKVTVQSCPGETCEFTVGVDEIEVFGTAIAATPSLGLHGLTLFIVAIGGFGALASARKNFRSRKFSAMRNEDATRVF